METRENAGLVLRTIDIQTYNGQNFSTSLYDTDNELGTISDNGQFLIFKGINMRQVLGTLYDKYDMFNVSLRTYLSAPNSTASVNNVACSLWLTGLNWVNQTYSVKTKNFNTEACIGGCNFQATTTNGQVTHHSSNTAMFRKGPPDVTDLIIEFKNSAGTIVANATKYEKISQDIGHQQFIFDFYGVDGYETNRANTIIPINNTMSYDNNKQEQYNTPSYLGNNNKSFR